MKDEYYCMGDLRIVSRSYCKGYLHPGNQGGGILTTMILGIVGAFIGGSLTTLLQTGTLQFTAASLSIPGVVVAVLGAMLAIFLWGLMNRSAA
jgi:uncharacterized membrane protein YeaQ/YmgE (transglycosylase-associated protein family)